MARYCSKSCQQSDWKEHKETCRPLHKVPAEIAKPGHTETRRPQCPDPATNEKTAGAPSKVLVDASDQCRDFDETPAGKARPCRVAGCTSPAVDHEDATLGHTKYDTEDFTLCTDHSKEYYGKKEGIGPCGMCGKRNLYPSGEVRGAFGRPSVGYCPGCCEALLETMRGSPVVRGNRLLNYLVTRKKLIDIRADEETEQKPQTCPSIYKRVSDTAFTAPDKLRPAACVCALCKRRATTVVQNACADCRYPSILRGEQTYALTFPGFFQSRCVTCGDSRLSSRRPEVKNHCSDCFTIMSSIDQCFVAPDDNPADPDLYIKRSEWEAILSDAKNLTLERSGLPSATSPKDLPTAR